MALVTENLALIVFAIILIVSAIIAWFMSSYEHYESTNFHTFISVLAGLGIIVTFMFYYNVVALQNQQQQLAAVQELARINNSVLNGVLTETQKSSTLIPNFTLSVSPLTTSLCCGTGCVPIDPDPINPVTCTQKAVLSYRIFSVWQDIIISNKLIQINPQAYISNFLQQANSTQLYEQWNITYIDFNTSTQTLGTLLFEYGLPITTQTPQEYQNTATKLIADPRFKAIFK